MQAMKDPNEPSGPSPWARWGPLVAIVAVVAVVGAVVLLGGGDDDEDDATATTAPGADVELPPNVLPFSVAVERGIVDDIDWGARCDTAEGVLALPLNPPAECFAPYDGPGGGATSTGVTNDSIRVVVYVPQENDPILSFIYAQVGNDDTPTQTFETYENYNRLLATYMETYGRDVELVRYDATGSVSDEVAAVTDAETIARDLQPFVVIGGPALTNAFAETLAANQVMCISCTPGQTIEWY
jgi:hypothetical protein